MRFNVIWPASLAIAAACAVTPAMAAPSGSLAADYDYSSTSIAGHSFNSNGGSVAGNIAGDIAPHWTLQGDAAYQGQSASVSGTSVSAHFGDGTVSGFYSGSQGRIGASVGYGQLSESVSGSSVTFDTTNYGMFADWFASDQVTVSARGGGISVSKGGGSSDYFGGRVVGYATPDVALSGTIDYFGIHGTTITLTNYGVGAEWLVSHTTPFAVTANYTNGQLKVPGTSVTSNTFSIGGKFYFGGNSSLKDHQRNEAETWGTSSPLKAAYLF